MKNEPKQELVVNADSLEQLMSMNGAEKKEDILKLRRALLRKEFKNYINNPLTKHQVHLYDKTDEELMDIERISFRKEIEELKARLE